MIILKIASVGKTKEPWLKDALQEYEKRLSRDIKIEWILAKDQNSLEGILSKEKDWISLDIDGEPLTSTQLAKKWQAWKVLLNARVTIAIAGDRGWSKNLVNLPLFKLSLSPLTFTHQMCRLILLEQIYRSEQIIQGTEYNK